MARYEDMLESVRGAAYGAPDVVLMRALVRATQELCKSSQCWRAVLDDDYTQTGVSTYELQAPPDINVDRIIWVKVGDQPVRTQARPDDLLARPHATGAPSVFAQDATRQQLHLWPAPDQDQHPIQVFAALSPTTRARWLPDGLVDEYAAGIVAAAKSDLLLNSPDMPFHNPQAAMVQRMMADQIFTRAKRAQHSGHSMPLSVVPRRFV